MFGLFKCLWCWRGSFLTVTVALPQVCGILTDVCIRNGNLDFPYEAKLNGFFPADAYATREKHPRGRPINLRADGQVRSTDIRVKSIRWINPRARVGALMKRLKCKPGDKVRMYRRGVRDYELEFV